MRRADLSDQFGQGDCIAGTQGISISRLNDKGVSFGAGRLETDVSTASAKGTRKGALPRDDLITCTERSTFIPFGRTFSARYRWVYAGLQGSPSVHVEREESTTKKERKSHDYYNVDKYAKQSTEKLPPRALPIRVLRRVLAVFDPTQGFWIILLGLPLVYGLGVGLLMLGLKYGALGFYGGVGLLLTLGTYILEKQYGKHLQIDDFPLVKRLVTIVPAFLVLAGIFLLVFYLTGKI